jgi:WD40 repeat protein
VNEGREIRTLRGHSLWVNTLAVLPNGDLASGSGDDSIKIWNVIIDNYFFIMASTYYSKKLECFILLY